MTKHELIEFMQNQLGIDTSDIDGCTPLFSSGTIDSFALVALITFIEAQAGFRMLPFEVNLDTMDSIDRILAFVARRRAA